MRTIVVLLGMNVLISSALAQQSQDQTVAVGSWNIATTYKAEKFDNCTMSRTVGDLGISFVQTQDGLLLLLDSPKWKLERGKAYSVRLIAGSQSVDAKALAETKGVTIALADRPFNGKLRSANALDVRHHVARAFGQKRRGVRSTRDLFRKKWSQWSGDQSVCFT